MVDWYFRSWVLADVHSDDFLQLLHRSFPGAFSWTMEWCFQSVQCWCEGKPGALPVPHHPSGRSDAVAMMPREWSPFAENTKSKSSCTSTTWWLSIILCFRLLTDMDVFTQVRNTSGPKRIARLIIFSGSMTMLIVEPSYESVLV